MAVSVKKIDKAFNILKEYNGKSPYIKYLKDTILSGKSSMTDFVTEYILNNYNQEPEYINKTIKIADWFGEKLNEKYNIGFAPTKLKIGYVIGSLGDSLHCYVKYRKSQENATLIYLPNRAMLDDIYDENYEELDIDFTQYDKMSKKGFSIKEHQKTAVKFLISKKKAILADDMGLGKSISLIISSLAANYKKILIICPASLKSNWKEELVNYVDETEVTIVNGAKWKEDTKYTILNYDILKNYYELPLVWDEEKGKYVKSRLKTDIQEAIDKSQLFQSRFDLVIIDECHKLSNSSSMRYKLIDDFLKKSKPEAIYLATGTPVTNNTSNLYNILKLINADIIKDYEYYMKRYCGAFKMFNKKLNRDILIPKGSTNLEELKEKIKHLYIRRTTKDIGLDVAQHKEILKYDLTPKQQKQYDKLWEEYQEAQYFDGNDVSGYQALIEGTILRQWAAKEMIPNTIELAESHIDYGEKVIIMCCYDEEVELLRNHFKNSCVVYNGKMTNKQKDKAKDEFINDPKKKVFIGNIISAGVGLTLIVANVCIFNSFDWVSGNNAQAEKRIVRIGQEKDCSIYYQIFNNTIFEKMFNVVSDKQNIIDTVIKDETEKTENK